MTTFHFEKRYCIFSFYGRFYVVFVGVMVFFIKWICLKNFENRIVNNSLKEYFKGKNIMKLKKLFFIF